MKKNIVKTQTVVLKGPYDIEFEENTIDISRLDKNEIAAETVYSAISPGTETAAYRGDPPLRPGVCYPRVVGYCNLAEIISVNKNCENFRPGDYIYTFQSHRNAFVCKEQSVALKIPGDSDLIHSTAVYLYHLGYDALSKGNFRPGHNVAVVGLGTLGLTTASLCKVMGGNVYAFSDFSEGSKIAEKFGINGVFGKSDTGSLEKISKETNGIGLDIVVNTSNSWEDWKLSLEAARRGGTIVVLGFPGRGRGLPDFNPLASEYLYAKQLTITACGYTPDNDLPPIDMRFNVKKNCQYIFNLIHSKKLDPGHIISEVVEWRNIEDIYKRMTKRDPSLLTCVLKWTG